MNGEKKNTRLDSVRFVVLERVMTISCETRKQEACAHLYGVSAIAAMLAVKRRLNQELAAIAGLLHNYYFYKTGISDFPGPNISEAVRPLLRDFNLFAKEEQIVMLKSIFYQEDRGGIHDPYEEIVKDACLLQSYFHNTGHNVESTIRTIPAFSTEIGGTASSAISESPTTIAFISTANIIRFHESGVAETTLFDFRKEKDHGREGQAFSFTGYCARMRRTLQNRAQNARTRVIR